MKLYEEEVLRNEKTHNIEEPEDLSSLAFYFKSDELRVLKFINGVRREIMLKKKMEEYGFERITPEYVKDLIANRK